MIQDIAPHCYDVSFCRQKPQNRDYAVYVKKDRILLEKQEDGFVIPTVEEMGLVLPGAIDQAVYLFAIDGISYFLFEGKNDCGEADGHECGSCGEAAGHKSGDCGEMDSHESGDFVRAGALLFKWKDSKYLRIMQPEYQAFAAVTAVQLWRWRQSRRYCGTCGARTADSRTERALVCQNCGQIEYPKLSPAVIVAVTNGDKLLMSRYRGRAYRGYALIAGFVEIGETFEDTVRREVMEEVGLKVKNIRYFKSQPWAFSDSVMIGFFAELDGDDTIRLEENELSEAGWYQKSEIPDDESTISVGSEMKMAFKYGKIPLSA